MNYADIILPLPLEGTFTYAVSDALAGRCAVGVRVLVPFGKSKTYAALIVRVHSEAPQMAADKLKSVLAVLDDAPILLPRQLRL